MNTGGAARVKVRVESNQRRGRTPGVERSAPHRLLIKADALLRSGDAESAAQLIREILRHDASHLSGWETLARCLWQLGRFDEVVVALDRAISLNPYEPGYFALRGSALQSLGRYGEATESLQRAAVLPGCQQAIQELQVWQAGLVCDLLRSDPVFRASYSQDPEKACAAMGFRFVKSESLEAWRPHPDRAWAFTRPS